ncbi:MAG: GAF domain-containing protein [Actinomycetota bacterium]
MISPPRLIDETARQAVVDSLGLLDTGYDIAFTELVELATFVCHMPLGALSLIDNDRHWFKSVIGLDLEPVLGRDVMEIPRQISPCAHTIATETLVVPDTLNDERFHDNPIVGGAPRIRFYAGTSIVVDGHNVGTVCVMDTRPRTFLSDERRALEIIGRQAAAQLKLFRSS